MSIASGKLAVGAQLPSVRGLALQLTVNPKTVARAYGELASEGLLDARQGLGLFVAVPLTVGVALLLTVGVALPLGVAAGEAVRGALQTGALGVELKRIQP